MKLRKFLPYTATNGSIILSSLRAEGEAIYASKGLEMNGLLRRLQRLAMTNLISKFRKNKLLCFCTVTFLTACTPQPQYRTDIELIAPQAKSDRYCANNCLTTKQMCGQSCAMQKQNCTQLSNLQEQNDILRAKIKYDDYVKERTEKGQKIKRSLSSFRSYNNNSCDSGTCESSCSESFNICYETCGGKVIRHTYCVANCTPN